MEIKHAALHAHPHVPPERGAEWAPRQFWSSDQPVNWNAPVGDDDEAVKAYVNHGRWVVECPDCHGAQLACKTDRRFMCHCCGNQYVGGRWRAVVWPSERQVAAIEKLLVARPDEVNRNWVGESFAKLKQENDDMLGGV